MNFKHLPWIFSFTAVVLFSSFTNMYPGGSPSAKTGSPGDGSDCSSCHGQAATTTAGLITSTIPASGYVAGQTYQITATNTQTGSGKYGFEVSPQNVAGAQLGTLVAGTGSKLVSGSKYVTQSSSSSSTHIWTFSWIAPVAGTGAVTFYGAFARNYSGPTTLSTLTVQEGASTPSAAGAITGATSVCLNATETYSVGAIAGATSYVWTAPSGATILSGQGTVSVSVSFGATAVSGNISVYGSNTVGNGAASNRMIMVNAIPGQASPVTGSGNPCQSTTQTYSVINLAGVTYTWTVPSGSVITSGQGTSSINVNIGANNGNISTVPSNYCGAAVASTLTITVNPVPAQAGSIDGNTAPCQSTSQTYTVPNISGVTYTWNVPSGSVISSGQGTNSINVVVGANSGNISVVPSNSCGNGASSSVLITVNPVPAQTSSINGSSSPCQATSQSYSVTNVSGVTYAWNVPSGFVLSSGQGTNSINVTVGANNGNISVTPSNGCGSGAATNSTINVSSVPAQTSSISGNSSPCQSNPQIYSVTSVSGISYTWNVPTGYVITSGQGSNSIHITIGSTNGNITVSPSNDCGTGAMSSLPLTVVLLPVVPATPSGPDLVDLFSTTTSEYSTSLGASSYIWRLNPVTAGTLLGSTETAQVTWNHAFIGNAEISVKGQNNCGESTWSLVKATQVLNTTGFDENASGISVMVQEPTGKITLTLSTNASQAKVQLLDLSGKVLLNTTIPGQGTQQIEPHLKAGIYILVVEAGSSKLKKKILVIG